MTSCLRGECSSPRERTIRFHRYTKFSPDSADAVDLQALLDKLADFLLQSGFAGGGPSNPWGMEEIEPSGDRSLDALRQAIFDALIASGQFTPEMLEALRGDGDELSEEKLSKLLDEIVQRLIAEGLLKTDAPPQAPASHQSMFGPGGLAQAAAKDVQFDLTGKGIDFLGYKALRGILGGRRQEQLWCARHAASLHWYRGRRREQAL